MQNNFTSLSSQQETVKARLKYLLKSETKFQKNQIKCWDWELQIIRPNLRQFLLTIEMHKSIMAGIVVREG